jgi:cytochrome c553
MTSRFALALLIMLISTAFPALAAHHGDPQRGAQLAEQCAGCHGGNGTPRIEGFPNIANQKYFYLVKQLREMRTSAQGRTGIGQKRESDYQSLIRQRRSNEIMDAFVFNLSDKDIEDLAAYYSRQSCTAEPAGPPLPAPQFEIRCQVCHGERGVATNRNVPNIAGQDAAYLEQQLLSLKDTGKGADGEKRRAAIMEGQVRQLSAQDIREIALYYARLPCR